MIEINFTENFIKQQIKCLDILSELIAYDKQHGDPPEKTRVLEGFIDTQRKALETATMLFEKHKTALELAEREERLKREEQAKIEAAKLKEEQKKEKVKEDLKKATSDEGSLFCSCDVADEEAETQEQELDEETEADDGYGFEENDEE